MGDFKLPPSFGNEISTVGANPLGALFDDEVTEVTTGGGQLAETTGQTISRQFAAPGAPKGGDSEWVGAADVSTQHARDIEAQGLANHGKKFNDKIKARNAHAADKRKQEKEAATKAFKQRLANSAADRARMMARVADSGKTNEKARALRADNARSVAQASENLRAGGAGPATGDVAASATGAPAVSFAAPVDAGAPASGATGAPGETAR